MIPHRMSIEDYWARVADAEDNARLAQDPQARMAFTKAVKSWTALAEHAQRLEDEANWPADRRSHAV